MDNDAIAMQKFLNKYDFQVDNYSSLRSDLKNTVKIVSNNSDIVDRCDKQTFIIDLNILAMIQQHEAYGFNIDRGGTFTDFYVQDIRDSTIVRQCVFKVPSQSQEGEGPVLGIQQYLRSKGLLSSNSKIPSRYIKHINLGTTIATNALLQRKGCKNAMLLTEGFGDLLTIRHQARPNIFDLKCQKKPPLANETIQVSERVFRNQDPQHNMALKKTDNGGFFVKEVNQYQVKKIAHELRNKGIHSVGISFCNSYLHRQNQLKTQQILLRQGIENVELGCNYHDLGYLKRSETANLDAFLNPTMKKYFHAFESEFQQPQKLTLRVMTSNGGFDAAENIKASSLLLSGPAGGLIGCKSIIGSFEKISKAQINSLICLDMGGTSTDVSRIEDKTFETKYSFEVQGIEICTPHLEIDTIAAGGGSKLDFQNGMFVVGPESVGSNPGPVCYGMGDQLALTDANLILGRLDQTYFPKIFGKNKDESLNVEASKQAFLKLSTEINKNEEKRSIYEIAEGYVEIANELMAKSARKLLTMGVPEALVIFGSAGGQHCCDLANKIGVDKIFIHKYSGVLSAYGLSMAAQTIQNKTFLGWTINKSEFDYPSFEQRVNELKSKDLSSYSKAIYQVGIGYNGTSYTVKVPLVENLISIFESTHKKQNGFSLKTNILRVEYFVEQLIKEPPIFKRLQAQYEAQQASKFKIKDKQIFIDGQFKKVPVYNIEPIKNCKINGPALLLTPTSSIVLRQEWTAHVTQQLSFIFKASTTQSQLKSSILTTTIPDPIKLTLYSTRLMSIAQQMGKVLQKISISTNIRQRLDFSCGIFDWDGKLLANAPHLPVHLGSMETAVTEQINRGIQIGDVILTNHPAAGGSHLPDLTVVTCAQVCGTKMYLASRGHHADIGGISPGSMPAFSKSLDEEGVAIQKFKLVENGEFQQHKLRQLFASSRRIDDNVSDLLAQMAANQMGVKLLSKLISQYGVSQFKQYVNFICENAAESVRNLLQAFSQKNQMKEIDTLTNIEYMDDGTPIELKLTIDRRERKAVFDFTGTGLEVLGNTNAPRSITRSAILYCLRSLIGKDIPLNSGCLIPLTIIIPEHTILSPSKSAAVVGGNVQTSQRLVDLILKPFRYVACSQGTMNNFIFGTDKICYYETICGGSGAGQGFNGTTIQCHMTNTRITDVQYIEKVYPVIVRQFRERKQSGGKGKFKGGNGVVREFVFLEDVTVSLLSERRVFSAYGLQGGQNGQPGKNIYITRDGIQKNVGGKNSLIVFSGQSIKVLTPGGGGYGHQ